MFLSKSMRSAELWICGNPAGRGAAVLSGCAASFVPPVSNAARMTATKKVFIMVSRGVEASSILLEILAVGQQEGRTFELFLFISFCFACPHLNQPNPTQEPEKGTVGRRSANPDLAHCRAAASRALAALKKICNTFAPGATFSWACSYPFSSWGGSLEKSASRHSLWRPHVVQTAGVLGGGGAGVIAGDRRQYGDVQHRGRPAAEAAADSEVRPDRWLFQPRHAEARFISGVLLPKLCRFAR